MTVQDALDAYREQVGGLAVDAVRRAAEASAEVRSRLEAGGVDPAGAGGPAVLDRIPVLTKDDLPSRQRVAPPFGGLVADGERPVRIFASPGPIYEAQPPGPDPWRWRPALAACGIGDGDVVLNCFSYHLSPAGAMFDEACRAAGATVVPGGVGNVELQATVAADVGVTAFVGLPSYLKALVSAFDQAEHSGAWRVTKALVTAEPLPDELRAELSPRVPVVLMAYGTAEAGLIGHETGPGSGLRVPDAVYVQVCDPATGLPVDAGEQGEVVVTVVDGVHPLVRFGTGDLSRWQLDDAGRLALAGVLGRVGAAVKVRGMFIHPHQAAEVLAGLTELGASSGRFVVHPGEKDRLVLELVAEPGVDTTMSGRLVSEAVRRSQSLLRVRPDVQLADAVGDGPLVDAR